MHSPQFKLICCLILLCLSSCTVSRNISKKSELTEAVLRAEIIPGNTYKFELKSGQKLKVKITEVDSVNLYGVLIIMSKGKGKQEWVPFTESYSRLYTNVANVKVKEKAPFLTTILVLGVTIPTIMVIGSMALVGAL